MPRAFDGTIVPERLKKMPCGGIPIFDVDSGCAYRCDQCLSVVGSIAMPKECKELLDREENNAPHNRGA